MRVNGNLAIKYPDENYVSFTTPSSGGILRPNVIKDLLESKNDKSITNLKREQTLQLLKETYAECSKENWDNYGAKPIFYKAYIEAEKIIKWLPSTIPMPEIVPEPGGEIALEWYKNNKFVFVISVSGNNIITYAGIFGEHSKTHGTEFFVDALPPSIVRNILRLFPRGI
jgi:hypothetical protein